MTLGKAGVHAKEISGKEGGFIAPCTRPDFEKKIALVVRVDRQQGFLQPGFKAFELGIEAGDFFFGQGFQLGVGQHLRGFAAVFFPLAEFAEKCHDFADFGMLARELAVVVDVARGVFVPQQLIELGQTLGKVFKFVADTGFHGKKAQGSGCPDMESGNGERL